MTLLQSVRTAEELAAAGETETSLLLALALHDRVVREHYERKGPNAVLDCSLARRALTLELSTIRGGQ